jgi:adenylylsulfate kinase-like enzyme
MERDVKGLYAATARGEVEKMTGVADPYEPPDSPELHLETVGHTVEENVSTVLAYVDRLGRGS